MECKKCGIPIIVNHSCTPMYFNEGGKLVSYEEKVKKKEVNYIMCGIACKPDLKLTCVKCRNEFKLHDKR